MQLLNRKYLKNVDYELFKFNPDYMKLRLKKMVFHILYQFNESIYVIKKTQSLYIINSVDKPNCLLIRWLHWLQRACLRFSSVNKHRAQL